MSNLSEIPKDRKVFLLDHIGVRSAVLADELEKKGYTQLAVIEGGLDRWIAFNCDITVFVNPYDRYPLQCRPWRRKKLKN